MSATASQEPENVETEELIPIEDLNSFLDQFMFRSYDIIKKQKPKTIIPVITVYLRGDSPKYDVASRQVPPTVETEQIATMQAMGISTAKEFTSGGQVPVCAFLTTLGIRQQSKVGTDLTEKELADNANEVLLISGATLDGRICQAVYDVSRNKKGNIIELKLQLYMPPRPVVTEKSGVSNPLLAAFYSGFIEEYTNIRSEGGKRNGDIILPD